MTAISTAPAPYLAKMKCPKCNREDWVIITEQVCEKCYFEKEKNQRSQDNKNINI